MKLIPNLPIGSILKRLKFRKSSAEQFEGSQEASLKEESKIKKLIPKPSIGGIMNRLKFKKPSFGKKSASELFEPQAEAQPKKRFGITKKRLIIIVPILILVAVVATGQTPFGINTQGIIGGITQPSQSSSSQMQIANQDLINRIDQLEAEIGFVLDGDFSGAQGLQGETGSQGLRGIPGPTGEVAPIPIMLSSGLLSGIPHDVFVGQGIASSNYLIARVLIPYGGTIKDLHVVASDVPGIGINVVFVKNGFETTLFCELDSLTSSCSDTKSFVNVEPGDTVAVKIKKSLPLEVPNFSIQASVILKQPGS